MIKTQQSLYFHKKKIKSSGCSDTCENTYCSWELLAPHHSSGQGESCKRESVVRRASHSSSPDTGPLQSRCQLSGLDSGQTTGAREQEAAPGWTAGRGVCRSHTGWAGAASQPLLPVRPFWATSHLKIWHCSRVWRKIIQTIWECASLINLIKELASQSLTI